MQDDGICTAPGCSNPRRRKKSPYCGMHYTRMRNTGSLDRVLKSIEERYEEKVDRSGGPDACHPWTAAVNEHGYGIFRADGQMRLAHRWAYKRFVGPVGSKEVVRHSCDVPPCQNRRHWLKGLPLDNVADMIRRGRGGWAKGEQAGRARLTEEQVRAIRASSGPHREIAQLYGVSVSLIGMIRNHKVWTHI